MSQASDDSVEFLDSAECTRVSIALHGEAQQIVRYLVEQTNGYFIPSDARDEIEQVAPASGLTADMTETKVTAMSQIAADLLRHDLKVLGLPEGTLDGLETEIGELIRRRIAEQTAALENEAASPAAPGR